jgi:cytochrome c biogenesis protein CcmG/thiol:disulfide interchange protein DsbE
MFRSSWLNRSVAAAVVVLLAFSTTVAAALDSGSRSPEIGLKDLSGKRIDLASLKGKVVIVDFWASWCGPCKEEMPVLEKLWGKYKGEGLVVVAVSVDKEAGNIKKFLQKTRVSFPVVHDAEHAVSGRFSPPRMPSSYVLDRKGIVRFVHEGYRSGDAAKFEKEVKKLLAEAG